MAEKTDTPPSFGLRDFPDRLSPMLVKELRQGLRTRTFTMIFIALQILLALFVLLSIANTDNSNAGEAISLFVFAFFTIAVLIVQPIRGISAVSSEIQEKTIDLMVLTRLTSWRILFGKWASLVSQSALLFATVIPYLVIRYFFGGMQLFAELSLLGTVFILSAATTALFVGFSANKSIIFRGLIFIGAGFLGFGLMVAVFFEGGFDDFLNLYGGGDKEELFMIVGFLLLCLYAGYYSLEMGASRIATLVESTALRKRLIGLLMIAGTMGVFYYLDIKYVGMIPAYIISMIITGMLAIDCFTEEAPQIPRVTKTLASKGIIGRALGIIFHRGWHTGFCFILVLFAILWIVLINSNDLNSPRDVSNFWIFHAGGFYSALLPLLLVQLFQSKISNRFIAYLTFLVGGLSFAGIAYIMTSFLPYESVVMGLSFLPGMFLGMIDKKQLEDLPSLLMTIYLSITVIILFIYFFKEYKKTLSLEKQYINDKNN